MFKNHIVYLLIFIIFQGCHAQDRKFKYTELPVSLLKNVKLEVTKASSTAFDLTLTLPSNFVRDASIDYTDRLQKGIIENREVRLPNFPVLINEKGLSIPNGTTIIFDESSMLKLAPSSRRKFEVLRLHKVKDIVIYSPRIVGDRQFHVGTDGEWGMGIAIRSSTNVKIYDAHISECWGDGIYVGQIDNIPSRDIKIYNPKLDYNRRNGISITSVIGMDLIDPIVSNTNGTLPMGGIVVEPNSNDDEIADIFIKSPITFNNKYGIVIGLGKLIGDKRHVANVVIDSHIDEKSEVAFFMGGSQDQKKRPGQSLLGRVESKNALWKKNTEPFKISKSFGRVPILTLQNIVIEDVLDVNFTKTELIKEFSNNKYIILK